MRFDGYLKIVLAGFVALLVAALPAATVFAAPDAPVGQTGELRVCAQELPELGPGSVGGEHGMERDPDG